MRIFINQNIFNISYLMTKNEMFNLKYLIFFFNIFSIIKCWPTVYLYTRTNQYNGVPISSISK